MFCYIYKITKTLSKKLEDIKDFSLFNSNDLYFGEYHEDSNNDGDNIFKKQLIIKGNVDLNSKGLDDKVNFEIRTGSRFFLLETGHPVLRTESMKIIEDFIKKTFEDNLKNFKPDLSKEHELICEISEDYNLKFELNGNIIGVNEEPDIETRYCDEKLPLEEYVLYEADIELSNNVDFYYYRYALSIPDNNNSDYILKTFEKAMG